MKHKLSSIRAVRFPDSMYLPRKTFDYGRQIVLREEVSAMAASIFAGDDEPDANPLIKAYDRYWARELAMFRLHVSKTGLPYEDFLPGRFYTYLCLVQLLEKHFGLRDLHFCEIGCGTGLALTILHQKGALVEGFDHSRVALQFLKELSEYRRSTVTCRLGSIFATGYDDKQFDVTFNLGVLEHLSDADLIRAAIEMARISKLGVLWAVPNLQSPLFKMMDAKEFATLGYAEAFPGATSHHDVDLSRLAREVGMRIIDEGWIHIVPPSLIPRIPRQFLTQDSAAIYNGITYFEANSTTECIRLWMQIEKKLTKSELARVGWFKYLVGRCY